MKLLILICLSLPFTSFAQEKCGKVRRITEPRKVSEKAINLHVINVDYPEGIASFQVLDPETIRLAKEAKEKDLQFCRCRVDGKTTYTVQ